VIVNGRAFQRCAVVVLDRKREVGLALGDLQFDDLQFTIYFTILGFRELCHVQNIPPPLIIDKEFSSFAICTSLFSPYSVKKGEKI
ncbi:MAG: hypothetical protein J1F40_07855, partial [Prevotellaceae bacterium]|nr:hypothetical protein [Prevotellaceae bacterium]